MDVELWLGPAIFVVLCLVVGYRIYRVAKRRNKIRLRQRKVLGSSGSGFATVVGFSVQSGHLWLQCRKETLRLTQQLVAQSDITKNPGYGHRYYVSWAPSPEDGRSEVTKIAEVQLSLVWRAS